MAATDDRKTESGIPVKPVYTAADAPGALEPPGEYPFTRGPYPDMYRGRPWTIRQYAGFASAEESNARYRYLLERGQTGLSIAFDLPTQLGYDSDDPRSLGEVGRTGVAIDSIADMEILLQGIPLADVSTSMTINAPASLLLLLYELVAELEPRPNVGDGRDIVELEARAARQLTQAGEETDGHVHARDLAWLRLGRGNARGRRRRPLATKERNPNRTLGATVA